MAWDFAGTFMDLAPWLLAAGSLLILIALTSSWLRRMPLSTSVVCLVAGIVLGPVGIGLLDLDLSQDAEILEQITEVAVIISLFTAGLQLRLPFDRLEWRGAIRLAFGAMTLTVGLVAVIGVWWLGLAWGTAVILGALLAPTDPVLASDVQRKSSTDEDRLRTVLTGEAGFNDGTAFPFLMLGLGLLGLHPLGEWGWRWWGIDVVWAVGGGLAIGGLAGTLVGTVVLYLRRHHREAVGLDYFLAVGLIAITYSTALYAVTYGFLAVFAAGVALRRIERTSSSIPPDEVAVGLAGGEEESRVATDKETAPAYMAESVVNFNAQLERFTEVALVTIVGSMLTWELFSLQSLVMVALLLCVVRPLAVLVSLVGMNITRIERGMIAWFGIRGIGSLYYLCYAVTHGLPHGGAEMLETIALATVAISIVVHGISVTPLMKMYERYAPAEE